MWALYLPHSHVGRNEAQAGSTKVGARPAERALILVLSLRRPVRSLERSRPLARGGRARRLCCSKWTIL